MASGTPPNELDKQDQLDAWLALTGQVPAPDEPVTLPMLSGSMIPAIPVGAAMQILVQANAPCQPGDVMVFFDSEKLTAHRVLWVWQTGLCPWLLEKGDGNALGRWRRCSDIRGRVLSFLAEDNSPINPADSTLASRGLRVHLKQWLKSFGGIRAT